MAIRAVGGWGCRRRSATANAPNDMWVEMMSSMHRPCIDHMSSIYCVYFDHTLSTHRPHVVHFVSTSSIDRMPPGYRPYFVDEFSTNRMYRPYRPQDLPYIFKESSTYRHINLIIRRPYIAHTVDISCLSSTYRSYVVHISSMHRPYILHRSCRQYIVHISPRYRPHRQGKTIPHPSPIPFIHRP